MMLSMSLSATISIRLNIRASCSMFIPRVDPTVTTQAEDKSPMGLAIEYNQDPEVLKLLKQFVPMTDELKLEELFYRMNADDSELVGEEFHQLLKSLPVELVSEACVCERGTLLQRAIWEGKSAHAFLLLEAGVDPHKGCSVTHIEGHHSHSGDDITIEIGDTGERRERIPVELAYDTLVEFPNNKELFERLTELTGVTDYVRLAWLVHELLDYPDPVSGPTETFRENLNLVDIQFANSFPCHWARWGTLVQTAVEEGKAEHLRLILERGVDPLLVAQFNQLPPSNYEKLPLLMACERKNMEMVNMLEEYMEMTDDLKLRQLAHYILGEGRESASEEFSNILATLPLDLVRDVFINKLRDYLAIFPNRGGCLNHVVPIAPPWSPGLAFHFIRPLPLSYLTAISGEHNKCEN